MGIFKASADHLDGRVLGVGCQIFTKLSSNQLEVLSKSKKTLL